ncbi:hypothetical protein T492DRAFT_174598 [Pavlovales sp. CCMP2436]|nr:hypothetical protein T492DRAFT_174598 [Pavlovales sp. CCMP2436]
MMTENYYDDNHSNNDDSNLNNIPYKSGFCHTISCRSLASRVGSASAPWRTRKATWPRLPSGCSAAAAERWRAQPPRRPCPLRRRPQLLCLEGGRCCTLRRGRFTTSTTQPGPRTGRLLAGGELHRARGAAGTCTEPVTLPRSWQTATASQFRLPRRTGLRLKLRSSNRAGGRES